MVLVTLLTDPTPPGVLMDFYTRVKPPGLWGPYKAQLTPESRSQLHREHCRDGFLLLVLPWLFQLSLFLFHMTVAVLLAQPAVVTGSLTLLSGSALYGFWYLHIDKNDYLLDWWGAEEDGDARFGTLRNDGASGVSGISLDGLKTESEATAGRNSEQEQDLREQQGWRADATGDYGSAGRGSSSVLAEVNETVRGKGEKNDESTLSLLFYGQAVSESGR